MNRIELLLSRLDQIGHSLSKRPTALALIGLGSAGLETDRLDQYSDLDFFVIVKPGSKRAYLQDLSWLTDITPAAYYFANTKDGFKLLYEDGVFCEFAVFEESELEQAAFSPGRVIWKAVGVSDDIGCPKKPTRAGEPPSTEWLIGEVITNLYVGLSRERRGERAAALKAIQGEGVDRLLELAGRIETAADVQADPYNPARRFEQRYPGMAELMPSFLQGYEGNSESALAVLAYLERHFEINEQMKEVVLGLIKGSG